MLEIYKRLTYLTAPLLKALLRLRIKKAKEDPARLPERMGQALKIRPDGPLIWIHAASVGEAQSALILMSRLSSPGSADIPNILITTGTRTSAALMEKRLPENAIHQYIPLDHPSWVGRFLDHWRPDAALWMESELWPNMLMAIQARQIPAALINARLSFRSFRRWSFFKNTARKLLSTFSLILAQTRTDADRFEQLGAPNVVITDNLKYSAAPLSCESQALKPLQDAVSDRPLWLYASTHDGEEDLACRVHRQLKIHIPDLLTIIVPRHPDRRADILKTASTYELKCGLRGDAHRPPDPDEDIYIADTLGELGVFYTLSDIAVIGRSFSRDGGGGHNPVEAAQLNCAILTGPHVQFQQQIFNELFDAQAALQVTTELDFEKTLMSLLMDPDKRGEYQTRARTFADKKSGVIDTVMKQITPLLQQAGVQ